MKWKKSWWFGCGWGWIFDSIRKQVSSQEGEEENLQQSWQRWLRSLCWPEKCHQKTRPCWASVVGEGKFTKEPLWLCECLPPWQSLKTELPDSLLSSWRKRAWRSSFSFDFTLWELFSYGSKRREEMKEWSARNSLIFIKKYYIQL